MKRLLSIILTLTLMMSFTAFAADGDTGVIESDILALTSDSLLTAPLVDGEYLVDSLRLPEKGAAGSDIAWESNNETVISSKGTVTRPASEFANVILTATVSYGDAEPQTASFPYVVAPLNMPMTGIADFGSLAPYAGSDFTNSDWYNASIFPVAGATPQVSDGVAVQGTQTRFYWNGGNNAEVAYAEFVMKRTVGETVVMKPMINNGNGLKQAEIIWFDSSVRYYHGSTYADVALDSATSNNLKIGVYLDDVNHKYSLWINNALVADNVSMTTQAGGGVQSINFTNSTSGNLQFEEYRLYDVAPIDEETAQACVTADIDALTEASLLTAPLTSDGYLLDSLVLPIKGANYSTIEWSSSSETVISKTGTVTRPAQSIDDVVLTATVSMGSVSQNKNFTFKVAPLNMPMEGFGDFGSLALHAGSDFTNSDWCNASIFPVANATPQVSDGVAVQGTQTRFYWNGGNNAEVAYAEFVMKRTVGETVVMKPMINNGSGLKQAEIIWFDSSVRYYHGSTYADVALDSATSNNLKIGVYLDDVNHKYSLWINNALVADNVSMTTQAGGGVQSINFTNSTSGILQFEEYRFYNALPIDEETAQNSVTADAEALTQASLLTAPLTSNGYLLDSLTLPEKGENYSKIAWVSSNEAVISSVGTTVRPAQSVDDVVLTATISRGTVSQTKTFTFKVAPLDMPMVGIDDFGSLSHYASSDFSSNNWYNSAIFPVSSLNPEVAGGVAIHNTKTRFYWAGSNLTDTAYAEFVLKRTADEDVLIAAYNNAANGKVLTEVLWKADGKVNIRDVGITENVYTDELKVGIYVDVCNKIGSVWLDNVLVAKDVALSVWADNPGLQAIEFRTETAKILQFESYAFYDVNYSYRTVADFDSHKVSYYAPECGDGHEALMCYLAVYDDNELVALKTAPVTAVVCDGREIAQIEFTEEEIAKLNSDNLKYKAFMWSSDGLCKPLSTNRAS